MGSTSQDEKKKNQRAEKDTSSHDFIPTYSSTGVSGLLFNSKECKLHCSGF